MPKRGPAAAPSFAGLLYAGAASECFFCRLDQGERLVGGVRGTSPALRLEQELLLMAAMVAADSVVPSLVASFLLGAEHMLSGSGS